MDQEENVIPPILFHLYRKKLWNEAYTPKERAMSKIPKRLRGKGKKAIEDLVDRGMLMEHKHKKCVSLNRAMEEEIMELLKNHYPDYYFETVHP